MSWAAQRERGSETLLRAMLFLMRTVGRGSGQALLFPITAWFYAASPEARCASRDYLRRVLPHPVRERDVLRHFYTFACVILDRVFFLSGRTRGYTVSVQGLEAVTRIVDSGRGCVLLGSHLGSFDALRAFGRNAPVRVCPVMFRLNSGPLTKVLEALDPELARDVIEIGAPGAMLRVQEALERGEIVGLLADRTPGRQRRQRVRFLGEPASFPAGPFVLAAALEAPVVLCFGLRLAPRRYLVRFEPFAERLDLPRARRDETLRDIAADYASRVEACCRVHPFNWFNFYPFWAA